MTTSPPDPARSHLEMRNARASSVIVHRVPPDGGERFLEWQRGITEAAEAFPGYQSTDVYPSADNKRPEWVVVIHFDNAAALQRWLDSPMRSEWTRKLPAEIAHYKVKTLSGGFGPWFAGLVDHEEQPPPHWKMAIAVLFGLYPLVMVMSNFVVGDRFGIAFGTLVCNTINVFFLEWYGMPFVNRLLGPWLRANGPTGRTTSLIGLAIIVAVLVTLAILFHNLIG